MSKIVIEVSEDEKVVTITSSFTPEETSCWLTALAVKNQILLGRSNNQIKLSIRELLKDRVGDM